MSQEIKVTVNESARPRTVTLHLVERGGPWGGVTRTRHFTVTERSFIAALDNAEIVAPWSLVDRIERARV